MSTPKIPISARIETILTREATTGVPDDVNIWPRVLEASASVQASSQASSEAEVLKLGGQGSRLSVKAHQPAVRQRNRLFVAVAAAVMFLLTGSIVAFLALTSLMNPTPVSAAKILAQAEAAAQQNYTGAVRSTHAVMAVRFRNDPADPFTETQSEWWDQAPDKSRTLSTYRGPDNSEFWAVLGKIGDTRYMYTSGDKVFRIDPIKRPATTVGTDMNTATGEASSVGPFSAYDAELTGTESILGRKTYVLDLTLKEGLENTPSRLTVPQYRKQVWIDAESYLILQEYNWNRDGVLLYESKCQKLEINPNIDPSLFEFSPPDGYKVIDKRLTPTPTR
jgi:outer membrane lipoprotein-sorting protein